MDYNQRFELQTQQTVQNDKCDTTVEWQTVYAGYAAVKSMGSTEYWQAAAQQAEDTVKLIVRWHPALGADTRDARILWNGKALDIKSIQNVDERGEQAVIRAVIKNE